MDCFTILRPCSAEDKPGRVIVSCQVLPFLLRYQPQTTTDSNTAASGLGKRHGPPASMIEKHKLSSWNWPGNSLWLPLHSSPEVMTKDLTADLMAMSMLLCLLNSWIKSGISCGCYVTLKSLVNIIFSHNGRCHTYFGQVTAYGSELKYSIQIAVCT